MNDFFLAFPDRAAALAAMSPLGLSDGVDLFAAGDHHALIEIPTPGAARMIVAVRTWSPGLGGTLAAREELVPRPDGWTWAGTTA